MSYHNQKYNMLLNTNEAAEFLGIKRNTLEIWRMNSRVKIPYIKVGRLIKYRLSDLEEFLNKNSQFSTKDNGGQQ